MPHALSMCSMWKDLTNTMHYCMPTVCAECQTRWGAYCFLQPLHKPNPVFICFRINDTYCYWIYPVMRINCTSNAQLAPNFPHKKVLSTAKYGLQPLRKPSTHGFRGKKLLNLIFLLMVWWSITTNEPGHVSSSWALNLYRLSKLLFQGPYSLSNARFLPWYTPLYGIKILYSYFSLLWSSVAPTVASSFNQSITCSHTCRISGTPRGGWIGL